MEKWEKHTYSVSAQGISTADQLCCRFDYVVCINRRFMTENEIQQNKITT